MHPLFVEELPYDPNQVTPGVLGFVAIALVAGVVMVLMWDFNRRVRRINDREEAKERLLAEIAAAQRSPEAGPTAVGDSAQQVESDPSGTAAADPGSDGPDAPSPRS